MNRFTESEMSDILAARQRIDGIAGHTPLVPSPFMQEQCGREFLLKLEGMQPTGAFKIRGAVNAMMQLPDTSPGVVCCSTGNHGRGVAYAARLRVFRTVVCMSSLSPRAKIEGIARLGGEVRIVGSNQDDAHEESLRLIREEQLAEIPPFDHPLVIAGQGTIGLELLEERPDLKTILVPLSGGGLAAGVALAAKTANPDIRIVGITMDRGAAMHESIRAGQIVETEEAVSLADALSGSLSRDNRLTFAMCRNLLDTTVVVTEEEIYRAMQALYFEERIVAEGASAVGIAAVLAGKLPGLEGPVVTVITEETRTCSSLPGSSRDSLSCLATTPSAVANMPRERSVCEIEPNPEAILGNPGPTLQIDALRLHGVVEQAYAGIDRL